MAKILVIGDDLRSFLAVVRSLGRAGHEVHVLPERLNSISLSSSFIKKIHKIAPAYSDLDRWLMLLTQLDQNEAFDYIIPCTDQAMVPLMLKEHGINSDKIATPGDRAFSTFIDKWETHELAVKLGIARPEVSMIDTPHDTHHYPLFLKPKSSITLDKLSGKQMVVKIGSMQELEANLSSLDHHEEYFLESSFEGIGVGVSVLAWAGEVSHAFQHERVSEGIAGGSSIRKSVPLSKVMLKDVKKLAEATQLNGVAMFEFRYNPSTKAHCLLEVNARFWGSLPLALFAGVDFPSLYIESLQRKKACAKNFSYTAGKISRALTASIYDLNRSLEQKNSFSKAVSLVFHGLKAAFHHLINKATIDTQSKDDPAPFEQEWASLKKMINNKIRKLLGRTAIDRKTAHHQKCSLSSKPLKNILVLCYGNICRSPFLGQYLQNHFDDNQISVISAGFHMPEARMSPPDAKAASEKLGQSLGAHRSRYASPSLMEKADLILYFDHKNEDDIQAFYPESFSKSLNVGDFLNQPQDIVDPYGKGRDAFDACYAQIEAAGAKIIEYIERSHNG
ncbi:ATP-grasp domain-containing protein [Temperatibacter marinus]|uniref:protein-tyrosine-phosphatase n=1 Tax=Temperatibacter marinus TaxID=1456591 RepID=A0AA52EHT3_9PROT|nr:ATP-grasp domain-containing protein [Temperatibacter marinus]WND03040.1 ATP-grasp domain-containing protein [Temperatibacter marinus]